MTKDWILGPTEYHQGLLPQRTGLQILLFTTTNLRANSAHTLSGQNLVAHVVPFSTLPKNREWSRPLSTLRWWFQDIGRGWG